MPTLRIASVNFFLASSAKSSNDLVSGGGAEGFPGTGPGTGTGTGTGPVGFAVHNAFNSSISVRAAFISVNDSATLLRRSDN
jgi:hypothetical protein